MGRRLPISLKLLGTTLAPTVVIYAACGLVAHYVARRSLEDELGRRLTSVAEAAALAVRGERLDLFQPGDEGSRAYRNARRKLLELRTATQLRRLLVVDRDHTSRLDTDDDVAIGARYYALEADRLELQRVFTAGQGAASVLFRGHDGALYKRGFAPWRGDEEAGAAPGSPRLAVAVEGSAALYEQLAGFRRALVLVGVVGVALMAALALLFSTLLTRPLRRLELAARRIGGGDLSVPVVAESHDEIGFLAETLERMREQLKARDERLQMMLAGIAHEVRNPLGGMALFAGILRDELAGDPEKRAHVDKIERELGYLKTVVSDFLDYARRPRPELLPLDGAALLGEVAQLLAAEAERARVALAVEGEATLPLAGDAGQLRRALLNLGKNALQACAAGGRVTLVAARSGARPRLEVRDTGVGIAPDQRGRIFDPFFTTREKGTGLGLAFAREIALDHGGELTVDSSPGRGATFALCLPAPPPALQ